MSAALFERAAGGRHRALSAGTTPAAHVHPEVVAVMRELDINLAERIPRKLTRELAEEADVVVTMGCGDECPYIPGKRYVDWDLDDPHGRPVDEAWQYLTTRMGSDPARTACIGHCMGGRLLIPFAADHPQVKAIVLYYPSVRDEPETSHRPRHAFKLAPTLTCATLVFAGGLVLDVEDVIPHQYTLEVASPGLDRGLYKEADYERFVGLPAHVRVSEAIDGQRNFHGKLIGLDREGEAPVAVIEEPDGKRRRLPLANIVKANVEIEP